MAADLAHDTAVRADPSTPGRYHIALPSHWDYILPSGGVVMTAALRAAEAHLAEPPLRLASATTIFTTPIQPGELVADVHVLRRGRSATQVRVALAHAKGQANDDTGMELIATFLRERRGPDVIAATSPVWAAKLADALPVEDDQPNNPHARYPFFHQVDCKLAAGEAFWRPGFAAGPAKFARWFRYRCPQRDADGQLDRLAIAPIIDTMPTALHRAIGPGPFRLFAPSLDLTVYVVDDTRREWLLVATTLKRARAGWAIAEAEVWDDEGRFIAYGTQAMYLQTLSGEPPTIDASGR
jgi:acyl-coenzyme A thioesterase PaaI-like protein